MVAQPEFTWRRTAAGWERVDRWPNQAVESKRLNPLLVGSLQLGVSLVALMAGADAERHRHARAIQEAVGQSPGQSADMHVGINTT